MNQPVRDFLNRNQTISVVVVVVLLVVVLGTVALRILDVFSAGDGGNKTPQAYFYDQHTGQLFTRPASELGPVETDSGPYQDEPAGVRAHVYACGQCSDEAARYVGWLFKPLPPDQRPPEGDPASEATLIRRVEDAQWVRSDSPEGAKIMAGATSRCSSSEHLNYCQPDPE